MRTDPLFLFILLFWSCTGYGGEFRPVSAHHLSLDIDRFLENREPMTPDIEMHQYRGSVGLNWDVGLVNDHVLWRNTVHGEGTYSQFTTMGWKFQVAVPLSENFEVHYNHHSRHTLDREQPEGTRFPVMDSWGLKVCLQGACGR